MQAPSYTKTKNNLYTFYNPYHVEVHVARL